jgi:NADH-quinone oxidoreductase subunit C/D
MDWDFRKKQPYSGYEHFEFDIPTGVHGDCYDRSLVRVEEMRQSLRIIGQCVDNMPAGPCQSHHPLATPPLKNRTMHDIETFITHFLNVSWGPVIPAGKALGAIEATKGNNRYYLVSDGNTVSYRTRIRTAGKIAYISSKETNYRGDNSYETVMARPFRISHRGGRGQDFDRPVSVR